MPQANEMKRFTASMGVTRIRCTVPVAASQRPPILLQYVMRHALEEFLQWREGRPLTLKVKTEDQE